MEYEYAREGGCEYHHPARAGKGIITFSVPVLLHWEIVEKHGSTPTHPSVRPPMDSMLHIQRQIRNELPSEGSKAPDALQHHPTFLPCPFH